MIGKKVKITYKTDIIKFIKGYLVDEDDTFFIVESLGGRKEFTIAKSSVIEMADMEDRKDV